ncbi:hypothetical protein [Mycolicibacterium poriferae]|uniref:hypothetical protein n=1 Tax=Mycolicibacterium poriferae TaxID=39694 RepID=UPI0024BA4D59|nr:hypothetical protein [Mycolicibacterium poriferae]
MSTTKSSSRLRELQGKNAAAKRWDRPDKDQIAAEYAEQRLADFISRVIAEAPPLSDEQRTRIAALLRAGGAA